MNETTRRQFIAREGTPYFFAVIVAAVIAAGFEIYWLAMMLLFCAALVVYLFRGSERRIPPSPLAVVAPIDGMITVLQEAHDRYLNRDAIRIAVKPNRWGEFVLRGPIEGKIKNHWLRERGKAAKVLAREYAYWIQTDEGDDVVLVLRPRLWFRPIWYFRVGERVGQGQRCGFLSFGGKVEVLIPASSRIKIKEDEEVLSGSKIVAALTHE